MIDALIVVDVQNDFISGSLAVPDGAKVAELIATYIAGIGGDIDAYDYVVATQDWHVDPGDHWSETPDFVDTWPVHCKADTFGALIHEALRFEDFDENFLKGKHTAAYSGFEGIGFDSDLLLAEWLRDRGVVSVDVCGIATDYCVKATALDAVKHGFHTTLLTPLCAAVSPEGGADAIDEMVFAGVVVDDWAWDR